MIAVVTVLLNHVIFEAAERIFTNALVSWPLIKFFLLLFLAFILFLEFLNFCNFILRDIIEQEMKNSGNQLF